MSSEPTPYTAAQVRRIIDAAWSTFRRAAERASYAEFHEAYEREMAEERGHRAMGRRRTGGAARYRLPCETAARLFILQHTFEPLPVPTDWLSFHGYSPRVVVCQALRQRLFERGTFEEAFGMSWAPADGPIGRAVPGHCGMNGRDRLHLWAEANGKRSIILQVVRPAGPEHWQAEAWGPGTVAMGFGATPEAAYADCARDFGTRNPAFDR